MSVIKTYECDICENTTDDILCHYDTDFLDKDGFVLWNTATDLMDDPSRKHICFNCAKKIAEAFKMSRGDS